MTSPMTLREIAEALVTGCREGTEEANLDRLYAADAVSVEASPPAEGVSAETQGIDGIKGKHLWWSQNFEVVEASADGPYLHGEDRFAVIFRVTAQNRITGDTVPMEEVAVYHVADGKITREEFFYG